MKNIRMLIIGLVAGALLATAGTALAESVIERVTATARPDYKVKVDGKDVALKNAPLAYNGTTYVPLREAGEIFGYKVGFMSGTISLDQLNEKDVDLVEPAAPVETPVVETPEVPVVEPPVEENSEWIELSKVTEVFSTSWGNMQSIELHKKDGESLKLPIYYGMPDGEQSVNTNKGSLRVLVSGSGMDIKINSDDLKSTGFYPQ